MWTHTHLGGVYNLAVAVVASSPASRLSSWAWQMNGNQLWLPREGEIRKHAVRPSECSVHMWILRYVWGWSCFCRHWTDNLDTPCCVCLPVYIRICAQAYSFITSQIGQSNSHMLFSWSAFLPTPHRVGCMAVNTDLDYDIKSVELHYTCTYVPSGPGGLLQEYMYMRKCLATVRFILRAMWTVVYNFAGVMTTISFYIYTYGIAVWSTVHIQLGAQLDYILQIIIIIPVCTYE